PGSERADCARAPSRVLACPSSRSVPCRPLVLGHVSATPPGPTQGGGTLAVPNLAYGVKVQHSLPGKSTKAPTQGKIRESLSRGHMAPRNANSSHPRRRWDECFLAQLAMAIVLVEIRPTAPA